MFLDKYIEENGASTDYPIFNGGNERQLLIFTKDLFLAQYKGDIYNAVDIAVKYLAVENYYGINNYGFELYNKLQFYRIHQNWEKRFINLIESVEKGYDYNSFIDTDLTYSIHDGAHRVALCLFHDIEQIKIKIFNTFLYRRNYDLSWLLKYFTKDEINIIKTKLSTLLEDCRDPYYFILWPPAHNLFDQINKQMERIEPGICVLESNDIYLTNDRLKGFIYDIYQTDDIKIDKLDKKYYYMNNSMKNDSSLENDYPIRIMKVKIDRPDFRVKPLTGLPQSKTTMRLKTNIRDIYQKYINGYYYDIMMHSTDNTRQNKEVEKIIKKLK